MDIKYCVMKQAYQDFNPLIVKINDEVIKGLYFKEKSIKELKPYLQKALQNKNLTTSIEFLIGFHSISYQYWNISKYGFVNYSNNQKIDVLAIFDGFNKLWREFEINPEVYNKIDCKLIEYFFGDIPDKVSRVEILKESLNSGNLYQVTKIIEDHLKTGLIDTQTAFEVAKAMPKSFNEPYLKKVQLALYEIILHFNQNFTHKSPVKEALTVAADSQLPKVLEAIGILEYNKDLKAKIEKSNPLTFGSKEELAIRAATIIACEEISVYHHVSIPAIDRWLWLARNDFKEKNFHLTKTTAY